MAVMKLTALVLDRCPHCSVSKPGLAPIWQGKPDRQDGSTPVHWAAYACRACGSLITAQGQAVPYPHESVIINTYPKARSAHEDIPEIPRRFLQQAYDVIHAPDAAAMTAGSAVDAMLKHLGYNDGSVYLRIEKAVKDNILTKGMGEWAHVVRLGSNRPRHADNERPHVTADEAEQSVAFAEALGQFLFVLAARIQRGLESAKTDHNPPTN